MVEPDVVRDADVNGGIEKQLQVTTNPCTVHGVNLKPAVVTVVVRIPVASAFSVRAPIRRLSIRWSRPINYSERSWAPVGVLTNKGGNSTNTHS